MSILPIRELVKNLHYFKCVHSRMSQKPAFSHMCPFANESKTCLNSRMSILHRANPHSGISQKPAFSHVCPFANESKTCIFSLVSIREWVKNLHFLTCAHSRISQKPALIPEWHFLPQGQNTNLIRELK